jgi:chromosome partitioning protein
MKETRPFIVALAGQKGGSGKTTLAIGLACEWHRRGQRVLLVDADPQGSTRTWGAVAAELGRRAPSVIAMGQGLHRPDQLPTVAAAYDIVLIDCPGRHSDVQRSALLVADLALLPCGPSTVDAWALAESVQQIEHARKLRPELAAAVVINRKSVGTTLGKGARGALATCTLPVLATEVINRVAHQEAPGAGLGVTVYAPDSPAAAEIRSLVDEILPQQEVPNRAVAI